MTQVLILGVLASHYGYVLMTIIWRKRRLTSLSPPHQFARAEASPAEAGGYDGSKANPADIPTRPERLHELPDDVEWVEMALPSVEEIEGDLSGWIARAREARPPAWWVA